MLLICLWLGVYRPDGLNVFSSSLSPITDPYTARLWFATGGMRVNARICSLNMADATMSSTADLMGSVAFKKERLPPRETAYLW